MTLLKENCLREKRGNGAMQEEKRMGSHQEKELDLTSFLFRE